MGRWYIPLDGAEQPGREEIGGKAWSLAQMRRLGLPVPPAFVLPTSVCHAYLTSGHTLPPEAEAALRTGLAYLERETGRSFGAGPRPLLVSVRSGAPVSMPGMMDTVLDLGMNDTVQQALAAEAGHPGYARDTHARFISGYAHIVLKGDPLPGDSEPADLRGLALRETGQPVPEDPWEQLTGAVAAVFGSWQSARARAYRRHYGIPDDLGTAVVVQAMVFGNLDDASGTGVYFTRDPLTGAPEPYGEYLPGGQGEDVVAGTATPLPISELAARLPVVHDQLREAGRLLEAHGRDVQDIEFTVEQGRLYLLQSRAAKRSPEAAVRLAVDLADDGVIGVDEALSRVSAGQVRQLLRPRLGERHRTAAEVAAAGEPACPGAVAGLAVRDPDEVVARAERGEAVVFVAPTTSPQDVHAMIAAVAVCTETGGSTSHAAVVCRGLGRPAVVGCGPDTVTALAGQQVTVDGDSGTVFAGSLPLSRAGTDENVWLRRLAQWAGERSPVAAVSPGAAVSRGAAVRPGAAPDGVRDLDALEVTDPGQVAAAVRGAAAARGSVLDTDEGVAAAVAAGLRTIVTEHPVVVLLAACAAANRPDPVAPSGTSGPSGRSAAAGTSEPSGTSGTSGPSAPSAAAGGQAR